MKIISLEDALSLIKSQMRIMVGGFMGNGGPNEFMEALANTDICNLTLICNDTANSELGVGKLITNNKVSILLASHVGLNPETGKQMISGQLNATLIPQGTLAERIRCGGAGLGGVLTPTGVGTIVEEGKQKLNIDGIDYLLELPLRADVAIIRGTYVDKAGNIFYKGSTRNFNPIMATAADIVIVYAEQIVECGQIDAENIVTPSIFVDYVIDGGKIDG